MRSGIPSIPGDTSLGQMPPRAFTAVTSCFSIFFSFMSDLSDLIFLFLDTENLLFMGVSGFCHSV
jgi:hypothetical protein